MKPKTVVITLLAFFALAGLLFWGSAKNGNTASSVQGVTSDGEKSELAAAFALYDFGAISMKNGNVSKDFTITNPTEKDITIRGIETSCMCTTALLVLPNETTKGPFGMAGMGGMTTTNETIKVGESRTLKIIYDPNAHGPAGVGQIDRFVTITDSRGGTLLLEIKALVMP